MRLTSLSPSSTWMGQLQVSHSDLSKTEMFEDIFNSWLSNIFGDWSSQHCPQFPTFHLTAGQDYEAGPYTVSFADGQLYAILMVPTTDDNTTELSEYFKVVINSTSQPDLAQIGSPNMGFITIVDNDPGTYIRITHMLILFIQMHWYISELRMVTSVMVCTCINVYLIMMHFAIHIGMCPCMHMHESVILLYTMHKQTQLLFFMYNVMWCDRGSWLWLQMSI